MIIEMIQEWFKELLIDGIISNLSGTFDTVNTKVGEIAGEVGMTTFAPAASPRSRPSGRFYIAAWTGLTEQPLEQRHEDHTDERHTAARHKLLHALRFC